MSMSMAQRQSARQKGMVASKVVMTWNQLLTAAKSWKTFHIPSFALNLVRALMHTRVSVPQASIHVKLPAEAL